MKINPKSLIRNRKRFQRDPFSLRCFGSNHTNVRVCQAINRKVFVTFEMFHNGLALGSHSDIVSGTYFHFLVQGEMRLIVIPNILWKNGTVPDYFEEGCGISMCKVNSRIIQFCPFI